MNYTCKVQNINFRNDYDEVASEKEKRLNKEKENIILQQEDTSLKFLDMYNSIYSMRQDLERVKKPVGTRDNPARTCKDLYYGHSQFTNG